MLSKQERERIRQCIEQAASSDHAYDTSTEVFGVWGDVALRDAPRLLSALDEAADEIERLRALIARLHKVVNLVSLNECNHCCLNRETKNELLTLLTETHVLMKAKAEG